MAKNNKKSKKGPLKQKELSERGLHLEAADKRQQCSSLGHGETVEVTDDHDNRIKVVIGAKCICGFKIRGRNHFNGAHHRKTVPTCSRR